MKKTVCFIPVRGIENNEQNKNLQYLSGEPLYLYTLRKLLKCDFIDEVYIDSNDEQILQVSKAIGAKTIKRGNNLATKDTDGHQLFFNEIGQVEADIYIQIICTHPFIEIDTIRKSLSILENSSDYDSVVLVKQEHLYLWENNQPFYGENRIPNRTEMKPTLSEAMGLYVIKAEVAHNRQGRIGDKPYPLIGKPIELVDIQSPDDLILAQYIANGINSQEIKYLNLLKTIFSSPVLSDVCDELGLKTVLPPVYTPNTVNAKILGRAKTLKIRQATDNDSSEAIYEALKSYEYIVENDIIVVGTDCPDLAYFGDLNMSLAIRAGASGAIIGGMTRDTARTCSAGFPVFAKGRYCKDIKGRGAVEGINIPITLDGVDLNTGDLIFGDRDGIVIIPRIYEEEVLKRAIKIVSNESKIIASILQNISPEILVEKHGFF